MSDVQSMTVEDGTCSPPGGRRPAGLRVLTMGCRLNAYESAAMERLGAQAGLEDAVVVNSCAVTNEAVRQTRQAIRRARRENRDAKIVVTGCAAQIDAQAFAAMEEVDAVIGNGEKLEPAAWTRLAEGDAPRVHVDDIMSVRETAGHLVDGYGDRARAFMQIQNGCDHRCTFCIIPYGRGNSRSVPVAEAVAQAQRLAAAGHHEIVLTGVDITSYGGDLPGAPRLGDLVGAILEETQALRQLRLSSIDGAEIDDRLVELIAGEPRVAPYLHLSIQSGDDMILKRMKRRHTRAGAIEFCRTLRARRPEIAFGADFIAGFPTETEEMFANTLRFVDDAGLNYLHVFPFSPREGTPAARMPQLARRIIKARAARLREKGEEALQRFLDGLVGREETGIVESGGRARLGNFAEVKLTQTEGLAVGSPVRLRLLAREGRALLGATAG